MNETTKSMFIALGAALALGMLGDALLRATPWGVNLLLWIGALGLAALLLARRRIVPASGDGAWMALPALFFAAAFAWRDSPVLTGLNGLALIASLGAAAMRTRSGRLRVAGILEYTLGLLLVWLHAIAGFFLLLLQDIPWKEVPRGPWYGRARAVGRGLLIALPLLLLFGALFVAADAVFARLVTDLFSWNAEELPSHLVLFLLYTILAGGFLRELLLVREWTSSLREHRSSLSLGIVEIGIALGLLDLLFLAFVLVQLRYLFGGAPLVAISPGLTYAEYARRGFFELVAVTALALPLLLGAHWLLPKKRTHEYLFRLLAGGMVAMLFVIMASALQRMRLYQEVYGLTELRLYTTAFMGWMAVLFLCFLATVLRGRRERFAFGALATGLLAVALLDALNPDALIVRTNARHANAARGFDARYVAALSADAVPELIAALPAVREAERRILAEAILSRWTPPEERDWRTWNHAREQAWEAVRGNQERLQELAYRVRAPSRGNHRVATSATTAIATPTQNGSW